MNYDVACTKQDCEDAAKIARLQHTPFAKMISQTAYNSITNLTIIFIYSRKKILSASTSTLIRFQICLNPSFKNSATLLKHVNNLFLALTTSKKIFLKFCRELISVCFQICGVLRHVSVSRHYFSKFRS